jgi:hypothetical protein
MQNNLIDHWSTSSMSLFLRNRLAFKKKYILKIYDDLTSPSAVVGKAGHKALESFYNGLEVTDAIAIGLKHINETSDSGINYGKTGSREKMLKDYTQAINFYFEEMPEYHEILGVEKSITARIKDRNGNELAIPAKAISDLIVRDKKGDIWIVDHKFVSSYSDGDVDIPKFIMQGMFNFHTIEAEFGQAPRGVIFNECKIAKNKDGSNQLQPYKIEFSDNPADFALFYQIYNDCTAEISKPDVSFLPNFDDMFDGQNSFEIYRSGIIGVEAPVGVSHKKKDVEFVDRKYVASKAESIENKDLSEEEKIRLKLQEFGISVEMQDTLVGATITQYRLKPSRGVKMSQFEKLAKDIQLTLKTHSIRVEAPIRGTNLVGIEVPSLERKTIPLTEEHFIKGTLNIPIGVDVHNKVLHKDLSEMPHLLIAGATGAGKSVMLNVVIETITNQMTPEELQLVLIDPKRVELSQFKNLPHLLSPVIFDDDKAATALQWLTEEMEERYGLLEETGVRSIDDYNNSQTEKMTKIVVVIDEFADLMLQGTDNSSEKSIIRIAQKARAVGIHLILATQRPSADVVTGLIKANIPTKIAFMTTSKVNSQIVLDQNGAEELTGKGDMLYLDPSKKGVIRLQALYR